MPKPMSKGSRGKVARRTAAGPGSPNRRPEGCDTDGIHPMTAATGNVKMNRMGRGVDRRKTGKGADSKRGARALEGTWF